MTIELYLPKDFLQACDIHYVQPEQMIHYFVTSVALAPHFAGTADESQHLGTAFFLAIDAQHNRRRLPLPRLRNQFMDYAAIVVEAAADIPSAQERLELFKSLYATWHMELIRHISKNDAVIDRAERKQRFGYQF